MLLGTYYSQNYDQGLLGSVSNSGGVGTLNAIPSKVLSSCDPCTPIEKEAGLIRMGEGLSIIGVWHRPFREGLG